MKKIMFLCAVAFLSVTASAQFYEWGERVPEVWLDSVTGQQQIVGGDWHLRSTFRVDEIETVTYSYSRDTVLLIQVRCVDTAMYNAAKEKYGRYTAEEYSKMTIVSLPSNVPCNGTVLEVGNTYNLHIWLWHGIPAVGHGEDLPTYDYINGVGVPWKKLQSQPLMVKELHGLCLDISKE